MPRFFPDEKNFDHAQKRKKNRYLYMDPDEVPRVMRTDSLSTAMVLRVVSSEKDVKPSFFFQRGFRVSASEHIKVLKNLIKP